MLNRCQGKHTGRTTAAPNGCQGPFYTHTKTHKHVVIYVHEHIYSTATQKVLCIHMHALVETFMLSAPAKDVLFRKCSLQYRTMLISDKVELYFNYSCTEAMIT